MTADPAGIPADYSFTKFPPRHRAVMTTTAAWANFASRAGLAPAREPGRHVAAPALWVRDAEDDARVRDIIRDVSR